MRPKATDHEMAVLEHAADKLAELGLRWDFPGGQATGADGQGHQARAEIQHPGGTLNLGVEVKIRPAQAEAGAMIAELRRREAPPLLIADYINPNLAERLKDEGVFFIDAAGNAYLEDKGLHVWVTGKRDRLRLKAERERRRAFQPAGLQVIFALLSNPEWVEEENYRAIAWEAGVALGTVQRVIRDLVDDGYVLRLGRFQRRLVEPGALLDAWVPAYVRDLRPRLLLGRFAARDPDWWRSADIFDDYGALWGGESAAADYGLLLNPGSVTIYSDQTPGALVVRHRLEKSGRGRVEFRRKFWRFETRGRARIRCVPPVLVYADLVAFGDARTQEAAERIRETRIDRSFADYLAQRTR